MLIHALPFLDSAFGSRLAILIHASPILDSVFGSRLHILIHCHLSYYIESVPNLNTLPTRLGSRQNRVLRHPSRQPIRIEYYVTRVVNQSESSITSPESSRLGVKTLLGSRLESARYSLSYYMRVFTPPVLISSHSYYSNLRRCKNVETKPDKTKFLLFKIKLFTKTFSYTIVLFLKKIKEKIKERITLYGNVT